MRTMKLTEQEYNMLNDILYDLAHYAKQGGAYFGYSIYNFRSQQEFNELYELWSKVAKARYRSIDK